MKKCYKCNVDLNIANNTCPLCHNDLGKDKENNSVFPIIPTIYTKHNLLYKILAFLSMLAIVICVFINSVVNKDVSWSLFVIAGITCFWLTLTTAIKTRNNFMRLLFGEFNLVIISSILWDYFTGFYMWSINYVLPLTCITYIVAMFIMRIFFKFYIKDYVFYITLNSFIGLVPAILLIFDIVTVKWPSMTSVIISVFMMSLMYVFNKKSFKKELERRFHF